MMMKTFTFNDNNETSLILKKGTNVSVQKDQKSIATRRARLRTFFEYLLVITYDNKGIVVLYPDKETRDKDYTRFLEYVKELHA